VILYSRQELNLQGRYSFHEPIFIPKVLLL